MTSPLRVPRSAQAGQATSAVTESSRVGRRGRPLPDGVRARMEAAFGTDLSDVTVREDGEAGDMDAAAFTRGTEISFAHGVWEPDSPAGIEVLGHELAHVLQQRAGRVPGSGVTEDPALEAEAHEAGDRVARGESAEPVVGNGGAAAGPSAAAATSGAEAAGPAQPGRFGNFFRGLFRRGGGGQGGGGGRGGGGGQGGGGGGGRDPDETPYQPIPAFQADEDPIYNNIPTFEPDWSDFDPDQEPIYNTIPSGLFDAAIPRREPAPRPFIPDYLLRRRLRRQQRR